MNKTAIRDIIPETYHSVFKNIQFLNDLQQTLSKQILETDQNLVISAPTNSGKTLLHELAIIRTISISIKPSSIKCIYIAPNKALCQQRSHEWNEKFSTLGLKYI